MSISIEMKALRDTINLERHWYLEAFRAAEKELAFKVWRSKSLAAVRERISAIEGGVDSGRQPIAEAKGGPILYAKVGGPPDNWAQLEVTLNGVVVNDFHEVNVTEGWGEKYVGVFYSEKVSLRVFGQFELVEKEG